MVNADFHSKLNTETIKKHGIIVENTESILKYIKIIMIKI